MLHYSAVFYPLCLLLCISSLQARQILPDTHPKVRSVRQILNRLTEVLGQPPGDDSAPVLRVHARNPDSKLILEISRRSGQPPAIDMQESLYDLCANKFGTRQQDALAMLLGHELVHLYVNHQWISQFGKPQRFAKEPASNSPNAAAEKQADYLGAFYAYLAGYQPYAVCEDVIKAVYEHYRLPDRLPGYPSKQERIAAVRSGFGEALELINAYRAGLILTATGNYLQAEKAFLYIIEKIESLGMRGAKEAYNAAAAALLWHIIAGTSPREMPYYLPVESDVRLRRLRDREKTADDWRAVLSRCTKYLDKALSIDKNYQPALLNWMAVRLLDNNPEAVIGKIKETKFQVEPTPEWLTMSAIAYAQAGYNTQARILFEQVMKTGVWYGKSNYDIFQARISIIRRAGDMLRTWWFAGTREGNPKSPPTLPTPAEPLIAPQQTAARNLSDAPVFVRMEYQAHTEAEKSPLKIQTADKTIYVWQSTNAPRLTARQLTDAYGEPCALGTKCFFFPDYGLLAELDDEGKVLRQWHVCEK